jgi:acyl-CoA hydrolase
VAILQARVNAAFGSSMEVEVEVFDEHPDTGVRRRCCDGFLTFVALGKDNRPATVAAILPGNDEERQRHDLAHARRTRRLASRPPR